MQELFEVVKRRATELGVKKIIVASSTGDSAKKAVKNLGTEDFEIIVVTDRAEAIFDVESLPEETRRVWKIKPGTKVYLSGISHDSPVRRELEEMGVNWIIQATEVFRGFNVPGGCNVAQVISKTLHLFGSGTKVAVEITLMACDAGAVIAGKDVIAMGGTDKGLNTALYLTAAHTDEFFGTGIKVGRKKPPKLRVKEVIYKRDW